MDEALVADCDVQRHDLPDIAHRLQELGLLRVAAADGDDLAPRREALDDITADEARPAEHRGPAISHGLPRSASAPSITRRRQRRKSWLLIKGRELRQYRR